MMERARAGVDRDARRRRGRQLSFRIVGDSRDAGGRVPSRAVPALQVVPPVAAEQPHAPRAAHRRRHGGVSWRSRRRRPVGERGARQAAVARHDGARDRAGRLVHSGRLRRELGRVLRRDSLRPGIFSGSQKDRRHLDDRHQELAVRSRHRLPGRVSDARRERERNASASPRRIFFPTSRCARRSSPPRSAASKIDIIVPGSHTDQRWVRLVSRRKYNELLREGIRIYEYRAGMTHAKVLNVDDLWVVLGTTNFDNRSFEHNDEVNVAIRDEEMAARLTEDFRHDLKSCEEVTLDTWKRRPLVRKDRRAVRLDSRAAAISVVNRVMSTLRRTKAPHSWPLRSVRILALPVQASVGLCPQ